MKNKIDIAQDYMKMTKLFITIVPAIVILFLLTSSSLSFSQTSQNLTSTDASSDTNNQTQEAQPRNTVQITKTSANSYNILDDLTALVGAFDTSYTIVGSSDSLNKSKDLIVDTVIRDFEKSPTFGYIRAANKTEPDSVANTMANPFVDQQMINSTIMEKLTSGIEAAHSLDFASVAIKCDFDMNIKDWICEVHGLQE